jgi:hypothetical protein
MAKIILQFKLLFLPRLKAFVAGLISAVGVALTHYFASGQHITATTMLSAIGTGAVAYIGTWWATNKPKAQIVAGPIPAAPPIVTVK